MDWEGFVFKIHYADKTATLTDYTGDKKKVIIPSHIKENDDSFIVKFIAGHKVYVNHDDGYLGREFVGGHLYHFRMVGAFRESTLTDVTIPESVTNIERLAFPDNITIHGKCGSKADEYAKQYGYRFVPI